MIDSGLGFVQPLFFVGVVENREDPRAEGRVQVRAFGVHGSNRDIATQDLPWATLIIGNHDINFTPPPLNAWVFGFFVDGRDAQQPMILGLIPSQTLEVINPEVTGWGAVPVENYDRQGQGSRPRDIGTSPMSNLATGEFIDETYNTPLEINRSRNIPIAGGCARGYSQFGNTNSWTTDAGESFDTTQSTSSRPLSGTERERIAELDSDPEFQAELQRLSSRYGISREQVYGIIAGESNYNPSIVNSFGYAGFFQFGRDALSDLNRLNGTNYTPQTIASLSPADQLKVYGQYLDRWNFSNSSGLGIIQAAPAFASRPGGTEVYAQGTSAWNNNPGWRGPDGRITVDSINAYYNRRNPPTSESSMFADGSSSSNLDTTASSSSPTLSRATDIRERLAEIDDELSILSTSAGLPPEETRSRVRQLEAEKEQLEEELQSLNSSGSTESQAGEPYRGYMDAQPTGCVSTWEEPASAYGAKYPYNRVIETASGHSIELDDTPGSERIMIWHQNGSYIQVSPTSTTHKNMGDSYSINERNNHIYIRGNNVVTIDGDCYTLIKGDKIEEIQGDYKQIVHGHIMMGAARSVEINGADRTDIRSASLSLDSNVENLNIRTLQNIVFESGNSINLRSKNIRLGASESMSLSGTNGLFLQSDQNMHIRSEGNMFLNPAQNMFVRANGGTISMQSAGSFRVSSDTFVSLKSGSTMDLQSDSNLTLQSDATINVNSEGLLSLSSESTYINAGGGDLNAVAGGLLNLQGTGNVNIKGSDLNIESSGALSVKGGSSTSIEAAGGALNLLSSANAVLTGSNVHISGSITYIDDVIQLSTGGAISASSAASAIDADIKEPIETAPYGDEFGGFDISPEADIAPTAEEPMSSSSGSGGPAAPPQQSVPERELTAGNSEELMASDSTGQTTRPDSPITTASSADILPPEITQDGHLKTVVRSDTNGTRLYSPNIPGQSGHRDVHSADYSDYASGLRPVWEGSLPTGISVGQNSISGLDFYVREYDGFYSTSDFVRFDNGTYARVQGDGTIVNHNTGSSVGSVSQVLNANLPSRTQAVSITNYATNRSTGVLRDFVAIGGNAYSLDSSLGRSQAITIDSALSTQAREIDLG